MEKAKIEMVPVKSSNVIAVGYKNGNMYVEFASGHYEYDNVPKEVYDGFLASESKGKYMWANVRGKYEYRCLPKGTIPHTTLQDQKKSGIV